jgi:adenylate cyclase
VRLDAPERPALALPDKPSLAVLPFQNMSGDPEQEYFADGMVEEIITGLSRVRSFFVIARNSSFTYKGRAVDVKQVGRELGVRYVLEGSVRKAGKRVRVTGQLVDASTGAHVWADRFDGVLEDIFDLEDRVTTGVVSAIEPALRNTEIARALNKPTENLDAYDLYLRALSHCDRFTRADLEQALGLLRRAIAIDPNFALAMALASWCVTNMVDVGWLHRGHPDVAEAIQYARIALAIGRDDPTTLRLAAPPTAFLGGDIDAGRMAIERAVMLNPNSAATLVIRGVFRLFADEWAIARDEFTRAMRLSPFDTEMRIMLWGLSVAVSELGEVEEALEFARRAIATRRGEAYGRPIQIHCLVQLGRVEEARESASALLKERPGYTLATARSSMAPFSRHHVERRLASLRAAGIPE